MLKTRLLTTTFLLALLLLGRPATIRAENQDQVYDFALHLKQKGELYRAVTEFERFRFRFPADPRSQTALYEIIDSLFQAEQFARAADACETYLDRYPESQKRGEVLLIMVKSYFEMEKYEEGAGELEYFLAAHPDEPLKPEFLRMIGVSYLNSKKWSAAQKVFSELAALENSELSRPAGQAAGKLEKASKISRRSPFFAGLLSAALPGAGQLYSGRPGDAFASLTVNGLFTYLAVVSFQEKKYVVGGLMALMESGWYSGNIYSAVNAAENYNQKQEETFIKRVTDYFTPRFSWKDQENYGCSLVFAF